MSELKKNIVERYDDRLNQCYLKKFSSSVLNNILGYIDDKNILDAGCGTGWAEEILIKNNAKHVDGFDIDASSIDYARKRSLLRTSFAAMDFNRQGFKENFYDVVISIEVIEHLKNYDFYLTNLVKSLKKGGILFLTTPNKSLSPGKNPYHLKEFTLKEMTNMLERNNLKIKDLRGLTSNKLSVMWAKIVPSWLTNIVRGSIFYRILVNNFVSFPVSKDVLKSETMIFLAEKIE